MSTFQGKASPEAKLAVVSNIASHLGWDSLRYDTWSTERKFNIWYFHDSIQGEREIKTKNVGLKYRLPN